MRVVAIILFCLLLISNGAFGSNDLVEIKCLQGNHELITLFNIKHPMIWGIAIPTHENPFAGEILFERILEESDNCYDASDYVFIEREKVYVCAGELFSPSDTGDEILITHGSLEVFRDVLMPEFGWSCL